MTRALGRVQGPGLSVGSRIHSARASSWASCICYPLLVQIRLRKVLDLGCPHLDRGPRHRRNAAGSFDPRRTTAIRERNIGFVRIWYV